MGRTLRPRGRLLAIALALALVTAACSEDGEGAGSSGDLPTVKLSALSSGLTGVALKAIDLNNFDEQNGFEGEFFYRDADASGQFFLQRQSDIAFDFDPIGAAIARTEGHNVTTFYPILTNNNCILVREDSPYQSPEDLVGKKVGHFGADSGTTTSFAILLQKFYGIDLFEQYDLQEASPAGLVELLRNGDVEAIFDFVPHSSRALVEVPARCMYGPVVNVLEEQGGGVVSHLSAMAAYDDWLQENKDLAQKVIDAWNDAYQWILDDPSRITQGEFAEFLGQDNPEVLSLFEGQVTDLPLYTTEWNDQIIEGTEAWVDLAAEQGVLIESNPGGTVTSLDNL